MAMKKIFEVLPEQAKKVLVRKEKPSWISPMLATLTHERFSRRGWIFECKFDGERCLALKKGADIRLFSRNRKLLNNSYPEIVEALQKQTKHDIIIDGEIVAFDGDVTSFSRLQKRMQVKNAEQARCRGVDVYYYVFDLLYLDGYDTCDLELHYRKQLLQNALDYKDPIRFTTHIETEGEAYYQEACGKGWEGVIAKRAASKYIHQRSREWLKFKCVNEQEFIIGGYTEPEGTRISFGALLVGYYDGNKLVYAGKVGTGYDDEMLQHLGKKLVAIEQGHSPFTQSDIREKGVHWVKPELVAQIGFTEWTSHGKLRHPRFLGLRRDKAAKEVVREDIKHG
jgi:bifunctional non-homologous end joining protein LigD